MHFIEENRLNWTRGDLDGEWHPSDDDVGTMFEPDSDLPASASARTTTYLVNYMANGSMTPIMSTFEAYKYCMPLRDRAVFKMKNLPWDVNLLNAFHNLHFTLFMADMNPVSAAPGRPNDTAITPPAWQIWILQLIYKAATECVSKDFATLSEQDAIRDYRISTIFTDDHKSVGMRLNITGEGYMDLWVTGEPTIKKDGTFGFKHSESLSTVVYIRNFQVSMSNTYRGPLKSNMKNMKSYITRELTRFNKMLSRAEFNRPEYALKNINGGKL